MNRAEDARWLDAAARIAMPFRGTTAENPTVGALVVSGGGVVLGRGVTAPGGRPHAETVALAMAGEGAGGQTLYVTLEPCNHWGRTPPCVDAVLASGIARLVCGVVDPDPRTAGQSLDRLRAAGIEVVIFEDHAPSRKLHEGFLSRVTRRRPFVTAKLAVSRDGMIGRQDRGNVPVTGPEARRWTHMQRALSDAVMVGSTTARLDDPRLDVRLAGLERRSPLRVVVAGRSGLPETLTLFAMDFLQPPVVLAQKDAVDSFPQRAEVIGLAGRDGRVDLRAGLEALAGRGVSSLLVEGGAGLNDALFDEGLIDRFHLLEGQTDIGPGGVRASSHPSLRDRLAEEGFVAVESYALGCDMLTTFEKH